MSAQAKKESVYEIVMSIPVGKVATYGLIARLAGVTNPRHVGRYLHENPDQSRIPCHRVVSASGNLAPAFAFGGAHAQAELLRHEGVEVKDNKIDLREYGWDGMSI